MLYLLILQLRREPLFIMALPPEILRILCACLVRDETPSNRTLQLMAFCGVCRRWREFGRETTESLLFDSTDTQHGPKTTLAKFKNAPVAHKRDLFQGASRLLTGKLAPGSSCTQPFCSRSRQWQCLETTIPITVVPMICTFVPARCGCRAAAPCYCPKWQSRELQASAAVPNHTLTFSNTLAA